MQGSPSPSSREVFGYGISAAPASFSFLLVLVMYMKYATETLGASPAAVGTVFLLAKFWNAVSDPLVGTLSDRTHSRFGRRKPWILASAPLIALFTCMIWAPPLELGPALQTAWIAVAVLGFYTAYTFFAIPHMAFGAELALDAPGRNRVFAARQVIHVLGMLAAGTVGVYTIEQGYEPARELAFTVAILSVALIGLGVAWLPKERIEFQGRGGQDPRRALRDVLANRHARLFLMVIFIDAIGTGGIGMLTPFVIDHVVGRKDLTPVLLGLNMLTTLAAVPLWLFLARYFEKRRLLLWSMLGSAAGFGSILFVGEGDWPLVSASAVISGAALSCSNTLGYTLKSEIIDCDEHATGERKEGAYFAGWSFVQKVAAGLMFWLVGWALEWAGFEPEAASQSARVQWTMVVLMGGFPLVCYTIGAVAFARFSLSEREHARIRRELDARAADPNHRATAGVFEGESLAG